MMKSAAQWLLKIADLFLNVNLKRHKKSKSLNYNSRISEVSTTIWI